MKKKLFDRATRHRAVSLVLAAVLAGLTVSAYPVRTAAKTIRTDVPVMSEGELTSFDTIDLWQWRRIQTKSDLAKVHLSWFILTWGGDNKDEYFAYGTSLNQGMMTGYKCSTVPGLNPLADSFYTKTLTLNGNKDSSPWATYYKRDDSKNQNYPRMAIFARKAENGWYFTEKVAYWSMDKYSGYGLAFGSVSNNKEMPDSRAFTFVTGDCSKNIEGNCTESGCVRIFWERGGDTDADFAHFGDKITMTVFGTTDEEVSFKMFVPTKKTYTVLPTMTLTAGETLRVDGDLMLGEGCVLTIEPGAVFSVTGDFINNGVIENYGTILLQDGANVFSAALDADCSNDAGRINCYGYTRDGVAEGNLIILNGARLTQPDLTGTGLFLYKGATCINNGVMVLPFGMSVWNAEFINNETGTLWAGFYLPRNSIPDFTCEDVKAAEELMAAFPVDKDGYYTYFELVSKMVIDAELLERFNRIGDRGLMTLYMNLSTAQLYGYQSLKGMKALGFEKMFAYLSFLQNCHVVNDGRIIANCDISDKKYLTGNGSLFEYSFPSTGTWSRLT